MITASDISVIIPSAGKRPEQLLEAIHSVHSQTELPKSIILVWDGSHSDFETFKPEFITSGIAIYRTAIPFSGVGAARNIGIRNATTSHIAFLDDDDIWLPNKLERQLLVYNDAFENKNGFLASRTKFVSEEGLENRPSSEINRTYDGIWCEMMFREIPIWPRGRFVSTSTYILPNPTRYGIFLNENLPIAEDLDFFARLGSVIPFTFVSEDLAITRIRRSTKEGLSHSTVSKEEWMNWVKSLELFMTGKSYENFQLNIGCKVIANQDSRLRALVFFVKKIFTTNPDYKSILTALSYLIIK